MEIAVQVGVVAALVLAVASIAGGVVLFRGSRRVGLRAAGISAVAGGVGVWVVFLALLAVSSEGQAPEPVIAGAVVSTQPVDAPTTSQEPGSPASSGMMIPRPRTAEELVSAAHVNVIVLGTIDSVLEEKFIGPYGEDGRPLPVDDGALPFTDYQVRIDSVLRGDGTVTDGGTLVLRMFGHLSDKNAVIAPNVFTLPNPGDHLLFALGRNPDGTYGSGPEGLLNVDGEEVAYADGVSFDDNVSSEQFIYSVTEWESSPPPCCEQP